MEKLFEIASNITNPISLTALIFLIVFVLFKGIIGKIGVQEGQSGYKLLNQLMKYIGILAVLTLILSFGYKTYEVFTRVEDSETVKDLKGDIVKTQDQIKISADQITNKVENAEKKIKELSKADLTVDFSLSRFAGANMLIGNNGSKIVLTKDLEIHWDYKKCPELTPPLIANVLIEYRYVVDLTAKKESTVLTKDEFKYGSGDIDKFNVDLNYPEPGIYTLWFTFTYKVFGDDDWQEYKTGMKNIEICYEF